MNKILIALAGVVVLGLVVFAALAWRPAIAEVDPPAAGSFDAVTLERGRVLAAAGYCATCHTAAGGAPYAGGFPIESNFGIIYSTNITADPTDGIGRWSEEAFARALRKGIRRDGAHLFPALPYTHFAKLSDEDVHALYAFMSTIPAVPGTPPENTLPAPLSWRALQGGWKLLFFKGGEFSPNPDKTPEWNRGAYLVEGLGHCSACHSPRNGLGAEETGDRAYAGAFVDGWYAPSINAMQDAKLPWTAETLYAFLRHGASPLHGAATGSMSDVVHDGLADLPDADILAIATYFVDRDGLPADVPTADVAAASQAAAGLELQGSIARGEQIYVSYCVSCHFNRPEAPSALRPDMALNSAIAVPDPTNFLRIVMRGVSQEEGNPDTQMPGFRYVLSDRDVADVGAYLRAAYAGGATDGWADLEAKVAEVRGMNDPMR